MIWHRKILRPFRPRPFGIVLQILDILMPGHYNVQAYILGNGDKKCLMVKHSRCDDKTYYKMYCYSASERPGSWQCGESIQYTGRKIIVTLDSKCSCHNLHRTHALVRRFRTIKTTRTTAPKTPYVWPYTNECIVAVSPVCQVCTVTQSIWIDG
jgi:hypothetical protein